MTRSGCGRQGKGDLEFKGNLGENKGECHLWMEVLGDGKGDLEVKGQEQLQGSGGSQG